MKGIKKCLLLALSFAISATLFAACGGGGNEDNGSSAGGNTESSSTLGGNSSEVGGGNSSESGEVELPDTSVEIPETDGAPVANEAEWNTVLQNSLSATNATIITTASENGTVMESGIVMIAGGVTYEKRSEKDGADDYYFYGEVDGQSYFWHSEDGTTWTVAETGWTPEEYATVAYELEGLDEMLSFASATWNADTGMYTGDSEEGSFSLKISDGKVVYISFYMESAMMPGIDVVYNIVYGQTPTLTVPDMPKEDNGGDIELPEIPETDGEEVKDETAWAQAWANTNAANNFVVVMTENYNGEEDVMFLTAADGKSYMYGEYADGEREYIYYGEVDGKVYEWYSADGKTWEVEEFYNDIAMVTTPAGIVRGIDQLINFSDVTYEKGYYLFSYEGLNFRVKFAGGYVVEFAYTDTDGEGQSYKLAYGNAEVGELPALPQDDVIGGAIADAEQWAKILANTDEQTNFNRTASGRIDRGDGSISVMTEQIAVANGNVYLERESAVHSGSSSSVGQKICYYQGCVDGVAYQWRGIGGGEWYVEEIEEVTDGSSIVELLGLDELSFAAATYEEETGTYTFAADSATISVRAVNDLICYAELTTDNMSVEYTIVYGKASVVLPSLDGEGGNSGNTGGDVDAIIPEIDFDETLGDDIVGEEASVEKLQKAIQNTYASTNLTVKGYAYTKYDGGEGFAYGVTYIADGKIYNYTRATGDYDEEFYLYIGTVNGVEYAWMSEDGKTWETGLAEEVGASGLTSGAAFGAYLDMFDCETATFDAQTGTYSNIMEMYGETVTVQIKVADDYVALLKIIMGEDWQTFALEYGNAKVGELPPVGEIGGGGTTDPSDPTPDTGVDYSDIQFTFDMNVGQGIVGEEVSDSELKKAIKMTMASTNFTMQGKSYVQGGSSLISANIANGKTCNATKATYPTETGEYETTTLYTIVGTVNGVDWAWMSFDGVNFEDGPAEDVVMGGWRDGNDIFGSYLQIFFASEYTFNENTGEYIVEADGTTIAIKIVDGEVKTIYMTDGDMYILYVITYGNALDFNLPPVTNSGESGGSTSGEMPSQEEWDYAFKTLLTCNNVGLKVFDERSYYDGTQSTEVAGYAVTENAIEYIIERRGDDETLQRMVFANENGEDTMYTFSNETGIWTKADSAFMSAADLWGMQTYYLGRYAGIYERMEWDAEKGCFYLEEFTYISGDGNIYAPVYNLCIYINGGQVMEITYEVKESEYSAQVSYVFYGYNDMKVTIPVDGQGDIGGESGGDIGGGEVELPDIDTSMIGEEVSAEAFEKILANTYAQENLRYVQRYENENLSVIAVANFADGKGYEDVTVTLLNASGGASTQRQYDYIGTVDGVTYMWISYDGTTWNCSEANGEDAISPNGSYFAGYLDGFVFASASFNSETGMYIMYSETATISLKIYKELIVEISVQTESENTSFVIEYGNASVGDLPPVNNAGSGSMDSVGGGTTDEGGSTDEGSTDATMKA